MKHSTPHLVSPRSETIAFLKTFARAYTPEVAAIDRYYNAVWNNGNYGRLTC